MTVGNAMLNRVLRKRFLSQPLARDVKNIVEAAARLHQCIWLDPSDIRTMYQDAAGTIPVTEVGQPVGLLIDKSGRGNHAYQTIDNAKPVIKRDQKNNTYLHFDGLDDFLVTNQVNFSSTDRVSVISGLRKIRDASVGIVCELSVSAPTNIGAFYISAPRTNNVPSYQFCSRGSSVAIASSAASYPSPVSSIVSGIGDIGSDSCSLRVNGINVSTSTVDQGAANYGNFNLYIGRRAGSTLPFNGHLYGLLVLGGVNDVSKVVKIERYIASKTGLNL